MGPDEILEKMGRDPEVLARALSAAHASERRWAGRAQDLEDRYESSGSPVRYLPILLEEIGKGSFKGVWKLTGIGWWMGFGFWAGHRGLELLFDIAKGFL